MSILTAWHRYTYNGCPIYVHPERPDWFVPSRSADDILMGRSGKSESRVAGGAGEGQFFTASRILSQLEAGDSPPYTGRADSLSLDGLKECWFHLTDRCNLSCRHCLFGASPGKRKSLGSDQLKKGIKEARALGCTLFYFTGGEPFIYPGFLDHVEELLVEPEVHVVVLTNGLLVQDYAEKLKELPRDRFHFQVSMDGRAEAHDRLRGKGCFDRLLKNISILRTLQFPITLSIAVNRENIDELHEIVAVAAALGIHNVHFLWHFVRGKGSMEQFVPPEEIVPALISAQEIGEESGVSIDNVETIRKQVFSASGTRYDLSNTGWESIAVGPDAKIYPSPALVGISKLVCGDLADGIGHVWRTSPVLTEIRQSTLVGSRYEKNPLKFLVGGGDIDHSYMTRGTFVGHDPYIELYNSIALWLISRQAAHYRQHEQSGIVLKMGDVRHDCSEGGRSVAMTHCNCVISLHNDHLHGSVKEFYSRAANASNQDIANPFAPEQSAVDFIPDDSKKRSYGCGSPVHDADLKEAETVVDLGSGSGVECFIAAEKVGREGKVFGVDMTDDMLRLARSSQEEVVRRLGYDNIVFTKGFLEDIPLPDSSAHVVISNCVINLSPDKRQTLQEVFRVLKPGGRLVVSDIVTEGPVPVSIKNDEQFRGECLGGAHMQEDLMAMLSAAGFSEIRLIKRFPYRQVNETSFFSLTFSAVKSCAKTAREVIYRGPFGGVFTEDGKLLLKGKKTSIHLSEAESEDGSLFVLNDAHEVTNIKMSGNCCGLPTEPVQNVSEKLFRIASLSARERLLIDCMVCGDELEYHVSEISVSCYYCGIRRKANGVCRSGHYVCDACHQEDALAVIRQVCTYTDEEDMITLLKKIRSHSAMPVHGPEHHALVPGIILGAWKARGGTISRQDILTGIDRGSNVPGGVCGFWGSCGAAIGAGIAFSVILEATPVTPSARQIAQSVTAAVLTRIASLKAGRCCQRESYLALKEVAAISENILKPSMLAEDQLICEQSHQNRECVRKNCLLWEEVSTRVRT